MTDDNEPQYANTDDFESYDEVESEDGQAELPDDNFNEKSATDEEVSD